MDGATTLTVGALAKLAGVTVRTLHHYDAIGLLRPSGRSNSGYRRYTEADAERLQRILFYRELEFGLDRIAAALADPEADALAHLRRQHALIGRRIDHLQRLQDAVALAMEAHQMRIPLTPEERFEAFGDFEPESHEAEVEQRWGDTEAYRESARRTAGYSTADWVQAKAEGDAALAAMAAARDAGLPPDGPEAMEAAEAHRVHIDRWFYPCSHAMHTGLAAMYLADPRFTARYEAMGEGMAQYVHDAIVANAARHAG